MSAAAGDREVVVGRIAGIYGVKGWVRVTSYTDPAENILRYGPWIIGRGHPQRACRILAGRVHGRGILAHIEGIEDREAARGLIGAEIRVGRVQFAAPEPGRQYWADLIGLRVVNRAGQLLGVVDHLMQTGANDVLVVTGERRRLLPYVPGRVVTRVDLQAGTIEVDWDQDF
jgi:16S rRNA processing protein RimM